jgi:hypothetical protein
VDNTGLKGGYKNVTRMRQHVVPVCECGGRNRIWRDLEPAKSPTQQVGAEGCDGQNKNGSRESEFLEYSHASSKLIVE